MTVKVMLVGVLAVVPAGLASGTSEAQQAPSLPVGGLQLNLPFGLSLSIGLPPLLTAPLPAPTPPAPSPPIPPPPPGRPPVPPPDERVLDALSDLRNQLSALDDDVLPLGTLNELLAKLQQAEQLFGVAREVCAATAALRRILSQLEPLQDRLQTSLPVDVLGPIVDDLLGRASSKCWT